MSRYRFTKALTFVFLFTALIRPATARIQLVYDGKNENQRRDYQQLIESVERIIGVKLDVSGGKLTFSLPPGNLQSGGPQAFLIYASNQINGSPSARRLLANAINTRTIYQIETTGFQTLGLVDASKQSIRLNFSEISAIVYRGLPRIAFDTGMIFFHELIHAHLGLTDPAQQEVKQNSAVKGQTVQYMNQIERELGLPERLHYYPRELKIESMKRYSIYFGDSGGRVELPQLQAS